MFGHTIGGAVFLSLAQALFTRGLRIELPRRVPGIDVDKIISAGVTPAALASVPPDQIAGVLRALCTSVNHVFYLTAAAGVAAFCFAWGLGWRDIRVVVGGCANEEGKAEVRGE